MVVHDISIFNSDKADEITSGDRTFDILLGEVGDYVHYSLVNEGVNVKNPVSKVLYAVTSVEDHHESRIVSIKPVMSWESYVRLVIKRAHELKRDCVIRFHGKDNILQGSIDFYNVGYVIVRVGSSRLHRNVEDIVSITVVEEVQT